MTDEQTIAGAIVVIGTAMVATIRITIGSLIKALVRQAESNAALVTKLESVSDNLTEMRDWIRSHVTIPPMSKRRNRTPRFGVPSVEEEED